MENISKISIIIPVYNVEAYIEQCLVSVYMQDVPINTYEVIVVNDGTRDNSMSIVNKYIAQYSNMIVVNQENKGLSEARNTGLKIAKGEYIWFIDSDDWIEKDSLGNLYQLVDKYSADVYVTPLNQIKEYSKIGLYDFTITDDKLIKGKDYLFQRFPYGASQRFILKQSFLFANNLKFYPNLLHEDGEFGPKMLYLAKDVYMMRNSIYNYRLRSSGSIMSSWKRKNSEDLIFIYKELGLFCRNSIDELDDKRKFNIIIFNTLEVSILFAKKKWKSHDFNEFYNNYSRYIKLEAFNNINCFTIRYLGVKSFFRFFFLYINPLFFFKYINSLWIFLRTSIKQ